MSDRFLSQQQTPYSIQGLPDYQTVFNQRVIPLDLTGHQYVNANNIRFTDSTDHTATDLILIDSASRNWDTEETNSYTVYLGTELQYVHSLELVDGFVPTSGYVIMSQNNTINFQETKIQIMSNTYTSATVPNGSYDIVDLLNHLSVSMTNASQVGNKYKCILDETTHKVSITSNDHSGKGIFNLIFTDGRKSVV